MADDRLTRKQRAQVRRLVREYEPIIQRAFIEAVENAKGLVDFEALMAAVERNDIAAAVQLLQLNQALLFPLQDAIRTVIIAGGRSLTIPRGIRGSFSFSGGHPRADAILSEIGARLVTEIGNPGEQVIRDLILDGRRKGHGVRKIAQALAGKIDGTSGRRKGGLMGLDGQSAKTAARVREILNDPEQIGRYFKGDERRYTRTSSRYTALVRTARDEGWAAAVWRYNKRYGQSLTKADLIDRIATDHEARLLKDRSVKIAKDQAFTALAQGRYEAHLQLLERPDVESVTTRWNHNTFRNYRDDH